MAVRTLNTISLCSGGAGLDLGLELAIPVARAVCYLEREAFAVARLVEAMQQGLLADAPVWSDVSTFAGRSWRGLVDGVIGGIPCQPHSYAGQRKGADDERDLWPDARKIINAARPWFVWIENVAGMLVGPSGQIAGAARVRRDLAAMSFRSEIVLVRASEPEVGASQERARTFILGLADPRQRGLQRWGGSAVVPRSASSAEGEEDQRQRDGPDACDGREDMADARSVGSKTGFPRSKRPEEEGNAGIAIDYRNALVDAAGERFGKGRPQSKLRSGRATSAGTGRELDDASGWRRNARDRSSAPRHRRSEQSADDTDIALVHTGRSKRRPHNAGSSNSEGADRQGQTSSRSGESGAVLADADIAELRRLSSAGQLAFDEPHASFGKFPPGPSDPAWAEIGTHAPDFLPALSRHDQFSIAVGNARDAAHRDPARRPWLDEAGPYGLRAAVVQEISECALRGVADGLVSRVDELRMLGNGVVPLQAAHAFRLLVGLHVRAGSPGAAELVRIMEVA